MQAHSSVEKASLIGLVKLRLLPCDDELSLRGDTLRDAIDSDRDAGLIPFFVSVSLRYTIYIKMVLCHSFPNWNVHAVCAC